MHNCDEAVYNAFCLKYDLINVTRCNTL